jgi:hypothetical protein
MQTQGSIASNSLRAVKAFDPGYEKVRRVLQEKHHFSHLNSQMAVWTVASAPSEDEEE